MFHQKVLSDLSDEQQELVAGGQNNFALSGSFFKENIKTSYRSGNSSPTGNISASFSQPVNIYNAAQDFLVLPNLGGVINTTPTYL